MKLKTSFIVPALLVASIFLFNAKEAKSQLVVGLGIEPALPVGDWATDVYVIGIGGSMTAEFATMDGQLAAGLKVGYTYLVLDSDLSDAFDSYNAAFIPIHLRARYFLSGSNDEGGIFGLAEFGVTNFSVSTESSTTNPFTLQTTTTEDSNSELYPSFDIGFGYEGELGLQAALTYSQILVDEGDNASLIGLRVAYNFIK